MYHISQIKLSTGTHLNTGKLTVAVGPNNGGKSQFLKDLVATIEDRSLNRKSVSSVEDCFPKGAAHIWSLVSPGHRTDEHSNIVLDVPSTDFAQPQQLRFDASTFNIFTDPESQEQDKQNVIRRNLGRYLVAHLTTDRRLFLVNRQVNRHPNIEGCQSPMEAAYSTSSDTMAWINERVGQAFGTKLILDKTAFATVEFRVGNPANLPEDETERKKRIDSLPRLDEQGDGIRSFSGILVTLAVTARPVVVIDEPEAFLHPPQAFLIGRAIAELRNRGCQIFLATHSAEVLQGVLSVSTDATIVRFSRKRKSFFTQPLDVKELKSITDSPVLMSSRVLDGLFYQGVAIVESDGDAILYGGLLRKTSRTTSIHLINSYSKQSSAKIAAPFLALKIPCAVLVDFDILCVRDEFLKMFTSLGGSWASISASYDELSKGMQTGASKNRSEALKKLRELPIELERENLDDASAIPWLRSRLSKIRDAASPWAELKRRGIEALAGPAQIGCKTIFRECANVGLFISTHGEREAWLEPNVPYTKDKRKWTVSALNYLESHELERIHPLSCFIRNVRRYLRCVVPRRCE